MKEISEILITVRKRDKRREKKRRRRINESTFSIKNITPDQLTSKRITWVSGSSVEKKKPEPLIS